MDIKLIGIVGGITVLINGLWMLIEKLTRSDDIKSLMKFKAQTEIKIKNMEDDIDCNHKSNTARYESIMNKVSVMDSKIDIINGKVEKMMGAFDMMMLWLKNGKSKK